MWSRICGVLCRVLLVGSGLVLGFGALVMVTPVQTLATANVTIRAHAGPQVPRSVAVVVRSLPGYGLTPSERAAGLPPLNDEEGVEAVWDQTGFSASLPPLQYCTHFFLWQDGPPGPPAFFVLRFSDAPSEEYLLAGRGSRVLYFVRDLDGEEVPPELATWKLGVGRMRRDGNAARAKAWVLELEVERQGAGEAAEGDEGVA